MKDTKSNDVLKRKTKSGGGKEVMRKIFAKEVSFPKGWVGFQPKLFRGRRTAWAKKLGRVR